MDDLLIAVVLLRFALEPLPGKELRVTRARGRGAGRARRGGAGLR